MEKANQERDFDKALFIRDWDSKTKKTTIYFIPEEKWQKEEFIVRSDDAVAAPIRPMIAKGTIFAAVPETNPEGASCYLVNLADLWVNHQDDDKD